ncbi:MAG: GerMN domain-containing protein [Vicinamibacterales bacterium]
MTRRRYIQAGLGLLLLCACAFLVGRGLDRLFRPTAVSEPPPAATLPPAGVPHITATLFYGTEDGEAITGVRREVPLAGDIVAQGKQILTAQMDAAPPPYVSVVPSGTEVRAFYTTSKGDAFVDLSRTVTDAHGGGSHAELLTVYAIVNAVTTNLPSIQRVQILIDGKQADTLAGHVDLRRPLDRNNAFVRSAPIEP